MTMNMRINRNLLVWICLAAIPIAMMANEEGQKRGELEKWHAKADVYLQKVEKQPDWLVSRLQMYWATHSTDVYIDGERFDHPGGNRAPVPTVKYNGSRGTESSYDRPKLADLLPYDDDEQGSVTYISRITGKMEKAHPSKTGCNIAAVNREILSIACAASNIYAATGDKAYGRMAADVFDVYLRGIYYRNVPVDLNHGHQQTLVGMTTFEVIHEDAINDVTAIYANLKDFLNPNDFDLYDGALKKWAENEIANGVPHNNWNLFQAGFISRIALVLRPDTAYSDGRGREYYLDSSVNRSSIRQWSMKRFVDFGFDKATGIWCESPGYSTTVLGDLSELADELDSKTGIDLLRDFPVIRKALLMSPQYLFPNRMIAGFGDTHPAPLGGKGIDHVLAYADRHADDGLRRQFDSLKAAVQPDAPDKLINRYVSPSFYAPNVSWIVQRTGMDRLHDLMISLNGSLGNHQHANGISMELYGKGYVLGPDAGIGKNLYGGIDYAEYYSQFPAHNTVCVDGISSYPVMMSHHAFKLLDRYPESNDERTFHPVTYTQLEFIEPESHSRQQRTNGIVKTSSTGGYYVDIFRSCKVEGGDKTHDYFYHNLGQKMMLTDGNGKPLEMHPTDDLAFAGGHLYAYSYIRDKWETDYVGDVKAAFTVNGDIRMTLWMRGGESRKIIRALSPENREYERMSSPPYNMLDQPVLTFIARQQGEAWLHPFVAVFEPSSNAEPSEIERVEFFTPKSKDASAVGIMVKLKNGRTDYIFSSAEGCEMTYKKMKVKGRYAVVSDHFTLQNNQYKER